MQRQLLSHPVTNLNSQECHLASRHDGSGAGTMQVRDMQVHTSMTLSFQCNLGRALNTPQGCPDTTEEGWSYHKTGQVSSSKHLASFMVRPASLSRPYHDRSDCITGI